MIFSFKNYGMESTSTINNSSDQVYYSVRVNKKLEKFMKWLGDFSVKQMKKAVQEECDDCEKFFKEKMFEKIHESLYQFTRPKKNTGPKRPKNAWIFYCTEQRPLLKLKNPELGTAELTKEVSEKWKTLSNKKKEKYEQLAEQDKKRYEEEIMALPEDQRPKKKEKGSGRVSGYMVFCNYKREEVKESYENPREVIKELARMWRELEKDEKENYNERASEHNKQLGESSQSRSELVKIAKERKIKIAKGDKKNDILKKIQESETTTNSDEDEEEEEESYDRKSLEKKSKSELVKIAEDKEIEISKKDGKQELIKKILGENEDEDEESEKDEDESDKEESETEEEEKYGKDDLDEMKLVELKVIAKKMGLAFNMKKEELIMEILKNQ